MHIFSSVRIVMRRAGERRGRAEEVERLMLAEARAEVGVADFKASMVRAALGIGFGAALAAIIAGSWKPSHLAGAGQLLWWVGALLALLAVASAARAVWPRYVKVDVSDGVHYWGHVATFKRLEELATSLDSQSHGTRGRDRTRHQLWRLPHIVSRKYVLVRIAIMLSTSSIAFFLLSVAFGQA